MKEQELIDKYLRQALAPEERTAFESRLEQDSNLASELAEHRKAQLAIRSKVRQQLRSEAEAALASSSGRRRSLHPVRRTLAIAATVIIIVTAGYYLFQQLDRTATPQDLYTQHFELLPPPSVRDATAATSETWTGALEAYRNAEFATAADSLKKLVSDPGFNNTSEARLYLGLSLIAADQPLQAIPHLEAISSGSSLAQDAQWYIAMAYLKAGDAEQATTVLREIAGGRHYKKAEAAEMIEELEIGN